MKKFTTKVNVENLKDFCKKMTLLTDMLFFEVTPELTYSVATRDDGGTGKGVIVNTSDLFTEPVTESFLVGIRYGGKFMKEFSFLENKDIKITFMLSDVNISESTLNDMSEYHYAYTPPKLEVSLITMTDGKTVLKTKTPQYNSIFESLNMYRYRLLPMNWVTDTPNDVSFEFNLDANDLQSLKSIFKRDTDDEFIKIKRDKDGISIENDISKRYVDINSHGAPLEIMIDKNSIDALCKESYTVYACSIDSEDGHVIFVSKDSNSKFIRTQSVTGDDDTYGSSTDTSDEDYF
jgi:hypothetical protein